MNLYVLLSILAVGFLAAVDMMRDDFEEPVKAGGGLYAVSLFVVAVLVVWIM